MPSADQSEMSVFKESCIKIKHKIQGVRSLVARQFSCLFFFFFLRKNLEKPNRPTASLSPLHTQKHYQGAFMLLLASPHIDFKVYQLLLWKNSGKISHL